MCLLKDRHGNFIKTLIWFCAVYAIDAYSPLGYKGCYVHNDTDSTIWGLQIDQNLIDNHTITGDVCIELCKKTHPSTIYAGTKAGFQCFCISQVTGSVLDDSCRSPCLGRSDEICGGVDHVSVYHFTLCLPNPCLNRGRCGKKPEVREHMCFCEDGFSGLNCEIESVRMQRWKGRSESRTFYIGRDGRRDFQACLAFCSTLDERSSMAIIKRYEDYKWFDGTGVVKKDEPYWVRVEDTHETECYQMYNSRVTKATSCTQKQGCLCQTMMV